VVFLDQFEEFFLRLADPVRRRFWAELVAFRDLPPLPTGEGDRGGEVRFVFSLREDFLAPLDEARQQIPELLGDSYRLVNLSDDKASTVITEPAARAGLTIAADLVSALLDDLREEGVIAPPQLQIVCDRLYRDCLRNSDAVSAGVASILARTAVTPADYRRLGGAKGILAGYVDYALAKLPDDEARQAGQALLKVLVMSRATKSALDWAGLRNELAESGSLDVASAPGEDLTRDVLAALVRLRLVREFERGGVALYELAHDHIAAEIATWIDQAEMNAKLARELLRRELESWRGLGKLIEPAALRLIHERRDALRRLSPDELELLFRSALTAGYEVSYWFQCAREGGVAVEDILRAGLESQTPNTRADAAAILGDPGLAAAVPWLAAALADDYPHVWAAHAALCKIGSPEALQILRNDRPKGMVYVPAGEFIMGDDKSGKDDEKPAHKIHLDAFYIGRYSVTNAEYARFVECTGRRAPGYWAEGKPPQGKENHPVVNVTWYDARDYARWAGLRLPTEAEWEKAASWEEVDKETSRQGNKGRKRKYPWGG
jgi:hypothetical protein